jgi:hypothetical protein
MAAWDLSVIRSGLVTNLNAIPNVQISGYRLANPTPPGIHVFPGAGSQDITYDLAMHRGLDRVPFTVQAFVGATTDQGAQKLLDKFINPTGTQSVKTAVEADRTLSGAVQDLHVTSCTGDRIYVTEGRTPLLGAEWVVEILALGA